MQTTDLHDEDAPDSPQAPAAFHLRPGDDYIELTQLLKLRSVVQSGGHAKIIIEQGLVRVNGEVESRRRRKLRPGDRVEAEGATIVVAAAGEEA